MRVAGRSVMPTRCAISRILTPGSRATQTRTCVWFVRKVQSAIPGAYVPGMEVLKSLTGTEFHLKSGEAVEGVREMLGLRMQCRRPLMDRLRRPSGSATARSPRLLLTLLLAAAATSLAMASTASAHHVTHSPKGKFLGVVHRGHHQSASFLFSGGNLVNHGGPVMPNTDVYAVYWDPSGTSLSSGYKQLVDDYFRNV